MHWGSKVCCCRSMYPLTWRHWARPGLATASCDTAYSVSWILVTPEWFAQPTSCLLTASTAQLQSLSLFVSSLFSNIHRKDVTIIWSQSTHSYVGQGSQVLSVEIRTRQFRIIHTLQSIPCAIARGYPTVASLEPREYALGLWQSEMSQMLYLCYPSGNSVLPQRPNNSQAYLQLHSRMHTFQDSRCTLRMITSILRMM